MNSESTSLAIDLPEIEASRLEQLATDLLAAFKPAGIVPSQCEWEPDRPAVGEIRVEDSLAPLWQWEMEPNGYSVKSLTFFWADAAYTLPKDVLPLLDSLAEQWALNPHLKDLSRTDLLDLRTYSWLATYLPAPTAACWVLAWNRWCGRPWRTVDVAAGVLALTSIVGAATQSSTLTVVGRFGSIALFAAIIARIVRSGPMRILATLVLALITVALFSRELLDPLGVPGIWFPFGIGVSRTQYLYAIILPLLAIVIARTMGSREIKSGDEAAMLRS